MNTFEDLFSEYTGRITDTANEQESAFIQYCKIISSIITDSFYVLDIVQKQFCYIKPDDLFLCGHSVEEAMTQGYDFYSQIIYPEDLPLWTNMLETVQQHLKDLEEDRDEIDYFSCTFRLQRKYSFVPRPLPQMIYLKMKPLWVDGELRYLICAMESSTIKNIGNLRLHKMGQIYKEYKFTTKRWHLTELKVLSERENTILMLAKQDKTSGEIADILCKGRNTIQNQINMLFKKLEVHSMQEAIEVADHYSISYTRQNEQDHIQSSDIKKRCSHLKDNLQRIQQHLNQQKSIRQIARLENTPESTIRYWINKGIIIKSLFMRKTKKNNIDY